MAELHGLLGYIVVASAVALLGGAVVTALIGRPMRLWLDRLILVTVVALVVAALSGLPVIALRGLPADPLHLVYAAVAPIIVLAARYLGRSGTVRRRGAFVSLGALALLGVAYRLFTTVA